MRLYLVRHGETEWTRTRRHTSRTDVALTPVGERQARGLGIRLAGFGERVQRTDALRELDYGEYEGLTTPEIRARRPGWDLFRDGCPGGETVARVAGRVRSLLATIADADESVLLFGHGHGLRVLAATFLGLEPAAARHLFLDTGSLSLLGREHDWPAILHWNQVGRDR